MKHTKSTRLTAGKPKKRFCIGVPAKWYRSVDDGCDKGVGFGTEPEMWRKCSTSSWQTACQPMFQGVGSSKLTYQVTLGQVPSQCSTTGPANEFVVGVELGCQMFQHDAATRLWGELCDSLVPGRISTVVLCCKQGEMMRHNGRTESASLCFGQSDLPDSFRRLLAWAGWMGARNLEDGNFSLVST
jgi:hypothetical protein